MSTTRSLAAPPKYQVPALEKGLDILECLAAQGVPLTQAQIARALNRGSNELFRMLVCLEQRGYVLRDPISGAYNLTLRLFTLSHTHSPLQSLLRAAGPPMRELAQRVRESCHLSVLYDDNLLVVAQEESPRRLRLSVEVGATFPILHTVSGRLLLAHMTPEQRDETLRLNADYALLGTEERDALGERLVMIRTRGYEEAYGETTDGVRDLAVLVGTPGAPVQAALTIAALGRKQTPQHDDILPALRHCGMAIGMATGLLPLQGEQE